MAEIDQHRELVKLFWAGDQIACPKHPSVTLNGSFVQTTYADHVFLECPKGKETIVIPQRPRQQPFNTPQIEGFLVNIQRGDNNLCYRCQAPLIVDRDESAATGVTSYRFTCVRCLSYGAWSGKPADLPPLPDA